MNEAIEKRVEPKGKAKLPLIGALFAGGLASACCVGPLVVVLLGLGGASAFSFFEPLRPYLIIITLSFLGWGAWTYKNRAKECDSAQCKPTSPLFFWSLVAIVLLLLFSPNIIGLFTS